VVCENRPRHLCAIVAPKELGLTRRKGDDSLGVCLDAVDRALSSGDEGFANLRLLIADQISAIDPNAVPPCELWRADKLLAVTDAMALKCANANRRVTYARALGQKLSSMRESNSQRGDGTHSPSLLSERPPSPPPSVTAAQPRVRTPGQSLEADAAPARQAAWAISWGGSHLRREAAATSK
jgi:hypothetical protein